MDRLLRTMDVFLSPYRPLWKIFLPFVLEYCLQYYAVLQKHVSIHWMLQNARIIKHTF